MEFWGEEVKPGVPILVTPHIGAMLHLSQAVLGETKKDKGNEPVVLSVKVDGKKFLIGTLKSDSIPQWSFDLVFHKEFELSHNWKHGSVYFTGYHSEAIDEPYPLQFIFCGSILAKLMCFLDLLLSFVLFDTEFTDDDSDSAEEEDIPLPIKENGKVEINADNAKKVGNAKANASKPDSSAKPSAKPFQLKKDEDEDDDDDSDEDESDEDESDDEDDSEEGMSVEFGESDDEDDESESEEEETPKKPEGKKRANDSATKTPVSSKKAKSDTPQKTDGKKGAIVSTPHPAKNAGKAAADAKKTPKSGGQFSCRSCEKSFGSDGALKSHTQAKHK